MLWLSLAKKIIYVADTEVLCFLYQEAVCFDNWKEEYTNSTGFFSAPEKLEQLLIFTLLLIFVFSRAKDKKTLADKTQGIQLSLYPFALVFLRMNNTVSHEK